MKITINQSKYSIEKQTNNDYALYLDNFKKHKGISKELIELHGNKEGLIKSLQDRIFNSIIIDLI